MQRVERHIVRYDKDLDHLCFLSKNLYNSSLYQIKQYYQETGKMLHKYELINNLSKSNQADYRALPAQSSQQVILSLYSNITSFFKALKQYKKTPNKFKSQPKFPNYKDSKRGRNALVFTSQQVSLKGGFIKFPIASGLSPLRTKADNLKQVRLVPKQSHFLFEVIYEREVQEHSLNKDLFISLDLGINNLIAFVSNLDTPPVLLNGKIVKAENQFFNKRMAQLKSQSPKGATRRMKRLSLKRENWIHNYFHQVSRYLINYCISHKIGTILVGYNKEWKQECKMGKRNNQKFVFIPFDKLLHMIEYKCEDNGIQFLKTEESYTSKIDHLAGEALSKQDTYMGRRVHRGLFKSSTGKLINADVNGALGISRKVFGDWLLQPEANRGFADNPVSCNILTNIHKNKIEDNQLLLSE